MSNTVVCYTLDEAINANIESKTVFIIANEKTTKSGNIGRYYTIFPTFKEFLQNRDKYKHCHEILVDHKNNKANPAGRLVFDFDIKPLAEIKIPAKFKQQIEKTVVEVVERYCNNVDTGKFVFIWSTSENPNKFSKHLTVKNLYFDNWITMSKIFYQLFCIVWDDTYLWIKSNNLIDFQIVRNKASLRMVGSSKIGGYPLVFDDDTHILTDSLIRIYFKNQKLAEQLVTKNNINKSVFDNVLTDSQTDLSSEQHIIIQFNPKKIIKPTYDKNVYDKAYEMYNAINPGIFKCGKINGPVLSLIRIKPHRCLLSGKLHEQENAFIIINLDECHYSVKFGCYRFCYFQKTVYIGSISVDNLMILYNPNFEPRAKKPRKKKIKIISV